MTILTELRRTAGAPALKLFGGLLLLTSAATLAALPYTLRFIELEGVQFVLSDVVVGELVGNLIVTGVTAGLGLWLGPQVGLGAPQLVAWIAGDRKALGRMWASLPIAMGLGALCGVLIVIIALRSSAIIPLPTSMPPAWTGLPAAFAAGLREEVWLRLGIMTVLVCGMARLSHGTLRPAHMWLGNSLAALLFGAAHIPQAATVLPLSVAMIAFVLLMNGVPGLVFGWLYWRLGLVAAIAAHFAADIVVHVIAPLVVLSP